ncbi:hypothetical protein [Falsigemmobacter faecalis]|nr:hypothetical protein [Falsigemmobacter faecalis]
MLFLFGFDTRGTLADGLLTAAQDLKARLGAWPNPRRTRQPFVQLGVILPDGPIAPLS